jgi:hypothetical protein
MSLQTWQETLTQAQVAGTAISASTTQASIIPAATKLVLPANFFRVGTMLKINAWGQVSNVVTTPGTLLFQLMFGGVANYNAAAAAMALNTTAKTNVPWMLELVGTCRADGATGNIMWQGQWTSESAVGSAVGVAGSMFIPASAPAVGANFDTAASQQLDLQAKFSVATAGTALTLMQYMVQSLN